MSEAKQGDSPTVPELGCGSRRIEVQGHPKPHSELKTILGSIRERMEGKEGKRLGRGL